MIIIISKVIYYKAQVNKLPLILVSIFHQGIVCEMIFVEQYKKL